MTNAFPKQRFSAAYTSPSKSRADALHHPPTSRRRVPRSTRLFKTAMEPTRLAAVNPDPAPRSGTGSGTAPAPRPNRPPVPGQRGTAGAGSPLPSFPFPGRDREVLESALETLESTAEARRSPSVKTEEDFANFQPNEMTTHIISEHNAGLLRRNAPVSERKSQTFTVQLTPPSLTIPCRPHHPRGMTCAPNATCSFIHSGSESRIPTERQL